MLSEEQSNNCAIAFCVHHTDSLWYITCTPSPFPSIWKIRNSAVLFRISKFFAIAIVNQLKVLLIILLLPACSSKNSDGSNRSTFCKPIAIGHLRARSSTPGSSGARYCSNSLDLYWYVNIVLYILNSFETGKIYASKLCLRSEL